VKRARVLVAAVVVALGGMTLSSACSHKAPPAGVTPAANFDWTAAWGHVLEQNVGETGTIDFVQLKAHPEELDAVVAWIGTHGPRSTPADFPTRESRIAYCVNSYNALALYNAITNPHHPYDRVRFFVLTKMRIDGRDMDLHTYENKVIRPLKEERIHFLLNCMVKGCPRLPRKPVDPANLESELAAAATLFLNEDRNVELHPETRSVRFSSILRFYTPDFLSKAPTLIEYANRVRPPEKAIPKDYDVTFIPYDWELNQT
jgi:hypothetical protein